MSGTRPERELVGRQRRHDQLCDEFEAAWIAGGHPVAEDYLARVPPAERADLLPDLLLLEVEYRARNGEPVDVDGLLRRFPDDRSAIAAALRPLGPSRQADVHLPVTPADATPWHGPPTPPVPPVVEGYEVLEQVDAGGMGVVWKARHLRLGMVLALKVVRGGPVEGCILDRFRAEARAVASLNHPQVVRLFDYGETGGVAYFTMEYVPGGSLAETLRGRPLPPSKAAELVGSLARTMAYVHAQGIVHRDLKPANVLLAGDGSPKVADFGLARRLDQDRGLTQSHAVLGTAGYMAPEQVGGARRAGPPADIYALGAILYECLTGRPPFRAETYEHTVLRVLAEDPVAPSRLNPGVPPSLETICLRCLEKDPRQRYAGAADLAEDLRRFLVGEPVTAPTLGDREWLAGWARTIGYALAEEVAVSSGRAVFRARHEKLHQVSMALKVADPGAGGAAFLEQLTVAAERAAALPPHSNLLPVYDSGARNGLFYTAMEFAPGGTLRRKLAEERIAARDAVRLIVVLARALEHVHHRGVVHGNVKPSNVLFTADGTPRLSDFGPGSDPAAESVYRAPELARRPDANAAASDAGPTADVYSLGVMLHELLTGWRPTGPWHESGPEVSGLARQGISPGLHAICARCMRASPAERYPDAGELADALEAYLEQHGTETRLGRRTPRRRSLPGFELLETLFVGHMGTLFKARQLDTGRLVALRVGKLCAENDPSLAAAARGLQTDPDAVAAARARVLERLSALTTLVHPGIVRVLEARLVGIRLIVAMELLDGRDLSQRLTGEPWHAPRAARLALALADALAHAHERGVVHRDVRPANVLFDPDGSPKLGDFELAALLAYDLSPGRVGPFVLGPPTYLAPEQLSGDFERVGPATDVYGVGLILYELLTGRPPFQEEDFIPWARKTLTQPPAPPSSLVAGVPAALDVACLRCLEKAPANRYPSAAALAADLRAWIGG